MRKLTPQEREAKNLARAEAHTHDENCGHLEVTPVAEVAPEVATASEVVAEEAPSDEPVIEEVSDEEVVADEKPKRKYTKKADAETISEEG